jgi:hypothetical protein
LFLGLVGAAAAADQTAFNGPHTVPGRIQAEDYDNGGAGVAYYDSTAGNTGGAGRTTEAVDIETANGITNIGWIIDGEWTEYTVTVATSGTYTATFRVGSWSTGRKIAVTVDGATGCTIAVPNTGSSTVFTTVSAPLNLAAGTHVLRLTYLGSGQNIDWFEFASSSAPIAPTAAPLTGAISAPTSLSPISSSPSTAELQTRLDTAKATANARLAAKQAAFRAWAIPSRPDLVAIATNARTTTGGLKSDGVTDNTAAFQALLNRLPGGATLYFPPGTYRIDGPISISKPLTLVGETGTVFNCQKATGTVFTIRGGSLSSKMSGMTITGITIEGPGIETDPVMMSASYLQNFHFHHMKFHNVGKTALILSGCVGTIVEDCVFDNVFKTGYGYGVYHGAYCDGTIVRNSFFVTKGRHGITTGAPSNTDVGMRPKQITVENNYFENTLEGAIDAHQQMAGPYIVRGNVVTNCGRGTDVGNGIADISNNVYIGCKMGISFRNYYANTANLGTKVDKITGNILINTLYESVYVKKTNIQIKDNVATGRSSGSAIILESCSPAYSIVTGNEIESYTNGLSLISTTSMPSSNNYRKSGTSFIKF